MTKAFSFNEDFLFDKDTGLYNLTLSQNQPSESFKERGKEKIPSIHPKNRIEKNPKSEKEIKKSDGVNKNRQNAKVFANLRWRYETNSEERRSKIKKGYFQKLMDKFRNPNYFPEGGDDNEEEDKYSELSSKSKSRKYVSSDTFRRHLSSSSDVKELRKPITNLESLASLLNKPKVSKENSEMFKQILDQKRSYILAPKSVRIKEEKDGSFSRLKIFPNFDKFKKSPSKDHVGNYSEINNSTITKISKVVSLLINLTASSSANEKDQMLDNIANGLSTILKQYQESSANTVHFLPRVKQASALQQQPSKVQIVASLFPKNTKSISIPIPELLPFSLVVYPKENASLNGLISSEIPVMLNKQKKPDLSQLILQTSKDEENPIHSLTLKDIIDMLNQKQ